MARSCWGSCLPSRWSTGLAAAPAGLPPLASLPVPSCLNLRAEQRVPQPEGVTAEPHALHADFCQPSSSLHDMPNHPIVG